LVGFISSFEDVDQDKKDGRSKDAKEEQSKVENKNHSSSCPTKCDTCQQAIDKALNWLSGKLGEKGGLGWFSGLNTALAGLAFLSESSRPNGGKYQSQVQNCLAQVLQDIQRLKFPPKESGFKATGACGFNVTRGFQAIFLCEVYKLGPSDDVRQALEKLFQFFDEGQYGDTKGWGYGFAGEKNSSKEIKSHDWSNVFSSHIVVTAMVEMRDAGIKINEQVLNEGINFLMKVQRSKGNRLGEFVYSNIFSENSWSPGGAGRTGGCLYSLVRSKKGITSELESSVGYLKKTFKSDWKYICDDGNLYNLLWVAFAMHLLGEETWREFWTQSRDSVLSEQAANGSWDLKKPLNKVGPAYATAMYLMIMQLPKKGIPMLTQQVGDLKKQDTHTKSK
jgi:hypothetical protein